MGISDEQRDEAGDGLPELPPLTGIGDTPVRPSLADVDPEGRELSPMDAPVVAPPVAVDHDPYLGKTFGGYVLEAKVGQGGMGVVYRGRQVSLDRVVAVKILSRALYDNQEFIKRFEREAKSIARINHPNLVAVYDFGLSDGLWFMVCEFIEGSSLARLISDKLVVPVEDLTPIIIGTLAGLGHVGSHGIVHRDIKPDNILITSDGQAKVADFGLAKDVTGQRDHTDLTAAGLAMGTPAYMSPEQCMGRKLDGRSDVYSLGVTAYFALTGEKPFTGKSSFEIMTRQREHMPSPPAQLNPRVPKELSDLVMRMLAKDPADRFLDAEECRQGWYDFAVRQGLVAIHRSGEFDMHALQNGSKTSGRMSAGEPAPQGGQVAPMAELPSLAPPASAPGPSASAPLPSVASSSEAPRPRRVGTEQHEAGRERQGATDRRPRPLGTEPSACHRCGHINRHGAATCDRCGAVLSGDESEAAHDHLAQAERLLVARQYHEAAAVFARLADREADRRTRSVLRSREQECRRLEQDGKAGETLQRARALAGQGDLRSAITMLSGAVEQAQSSPGASAAGGDAALAGELAVLTARLKARKRLRLILALAVVMAVVVAVIVWLVLSKPAGPHLAPALLVWSGLA